MPAEQHELWAKLKLAHLRMPLLFALIRSYPKVRFASDFNHDFPWAERLMVKICITTS
jgi:hypothetical protein